MDAGDITVCPTCEGKCINPYFASRELDKHYTKAGLVPWAQDGWAAAVIVDCGRAFEFLSWYRPLTIAHARAPKPTSDSLRGDVLWRLELPGTCSKNHFKKMELEKIGSFPLDPDKFKKTFPGLRSGQSATVGDISIANRLNAIPQSFAGTIADHREGARGFSPTLRGIEQILKD